MLLETVIKHYLETGVKKIILDKSLVIEDRITSISSDINLTSIEDVRSATFFALGQSQKLNAPVILVIDGNYLSNTFTGLTEAWFQRRSIIVISMHERVLNEDIEYLKRCTKNQFKVQNEKDFKICLSSVSPRLLPVVYLLEEKQNYPTSQNLIDLDTLLTNLEADDKLFVYESFISEEFCDERVEVISAKDKYGLISKYMGYCIGYSNRAVLIADQESAKLDMNLFNNRYVDKRFKVIFVRSNENYGENWIESNNISIIRSDCIDVLTTKTFVEADNACIWLLNHSKERR